MDNIAGANPLEPKTYPLGKYSSARLYMGGQLVGDIQEFGVVAVMCYSIQARAPTGD